MLLPLLPLQNQKMTTTSKLIYTLKLPWPPTINSYYGTTRSGQKFIGAKGKEFRAVVIEALREIPEGKGTLDGRLHIVIECHVPDRRRRDLDNILKSLLDAMTHAGVYKDDCLIDYLEVSRELPTKGGHVVVYVREFNGDIE